MQYVLNVVYGLILAITLPYWLFRSATTGKYREGVWRRFVGDPPTVAANRPLIWLHAVSVGEVLLLRPLIQRLQQVRPDLELVLSTGTNTGFDIARKTFPSLSVFYCPLDFTWAVRRVFDRLRPMVLVLAELELWPNLLLEAKRRGIPVAVVNARIGERSYNGYRRWRGLLRPALEAIHWWGAQSQTYADRIHDLLDPARQQVGNNGRIEVTGSMKFDGAPEDRANPKTVQLRRLFGFSDAHRVFVAGSTQAVEEPTILAAFQDLLAKHPELRLVLVPRHKERFDEVAAWLSRLSIDFVRRSALDESAPGTAKVVLVDTIGELGAVWGLADVAFVGGSLGGGRGGQSMIEPAAYGVPTCFGPETWNFQDIVAKLLEADAAVQLTGPGQLKPTLESWLDDPAAASQLGANARVFIQSQRGAVDTTADRLLGLLQVNHGRVESATNPGEIG